MHANKARLSLQVLTCGRGLQQSGYECFNPFLFPSPLTLNKVGEEDNEVNGDS